MGNTSEPRTLDAFINLHLSKPLHYKIMYGLKSEQGYPNTFGNLYTKENVELEYQGLVARYLSHKFQIEEVYE